MGWIKSYKSKSIGIKNSMRIALYIFVFAYVPVLSAADGSQLRSSSMLAHAPRTAEEAWLSIVTACVRQVNQVKNKHTGQLELRIDPGLIATNMFLRTTRPVCKLYWKLAQKNLGENYIRTKSSAVVMCGISWIE